MNARLQTQAKTQINPSGTPAPTNLLQRKCACGNHTLAGSECEGCRDKDEARLQRAAVNSERVQSVPPIVHEVLRSPGQPLDSEARAFFEPRFGHDFSGVRVHTDAKAVESARAVNALAYTVGSDVVFGTCQYAPYVNAGKKLLAHELTHVLQQRSSNIGVQSLAVGSKDSVLEREADQVATAMEGQFSDYSDGAGSELITRPVVSSMAIRRARPSVQRLGDLTRVPPGLPCDVALDNPAPIAESVRFHNRVSSLSDLDRAQIENFVTNWRDAGGNQDVRVDGFASRPGDDELNWRLSCERAQAVADELRSPSSGSVEGIPTNFISVFMHGETDEFGEEPENRRGTISLAGGGTPPPPGPTPPAPAPAGEEACQRARQVECVMRVGGCPNTRAGGIPEAEEIARYNEECRSETGYQGSDVTPTAEECRSGGEVSPTPEECRLARLEETHICGPDITRPLASVLADVRSTYAGWTTIQRRDACDAITSIRSFIMAWDIHQLFLPETGWLCLPPYHPPCGMPPTTGCDNENSADCGNSVEVQGKCFLAGTVNYALFGQICRLCNDEFGVLSESTMENLILGWKALSFITFDDPGPPTAWACAGFRGFPGNIPVDENRGHCRGRCQVPYQSDPFDWVWEPHQPR